MRRSSEVSGPSCTPRVVRSAKGPFLLALLLATGCNRNLELPPPPRAPGPGSVYGRVVYAQPGQSERRPAAGATVNLLGTNLSTAAKADGSFRLEGLTRFQGSLLFSFDADGNGRADRQKLVALSDIGAGPDKDIALGDVALSENARLHGKITRGDVPRAGGHGGTVVFVPEGPFTTYTNDDGSYALRDLPEGTIRINFFRAGYDTQLLDAITLRSGEDFAVSELSLQPATGPVVPGSVAGQLTFNPPIDSAVGTFVVAYDALGTTTAGSVTAAGSFVVGGLHPGIYTLLAQRTGYQPGTLQNVLAQAGQETRVSDLVLVATPPGATPTPGDVVILSDGGVGVVLVDGGVGPLRDAGAVVDAGVSQPDGGAGCVQGVACDPAPCQRGVVACLPAGALCVSTGPSPDGTLCGMGLTCRGGACTNTCAHGAPCESPLDLDACEDDAIVCASFDMTTCQNGGSDADGDGYSLGAASCQGDCDDTRAGVHPGAAEVCNGLDDDCDGTVDEGGNPCGGACALSLDAGCDAVAMDDLDTCTDDTQVCNGLNAVRCVNAGVDQDSDGFSVGAATCGGDCDDTNLAVSPSSPDACNSRDDDCDGVVDDGANGCGGSCALTPSPDAGCDFVGPADLDTCADDVVQCTGLNGSVCAAGGVDADGDGYSPGPASCSGDCDDTRAGVHPNGVEVCNNLDDDCDGTVDEGNNPCGGACALSLDAGCDAVASNDQDTCLDDRLSCDGLNAVTCTNGGADLDSDGYSTGAATCGGDCDDGVQAVNAGAAETCNGRDDDCDGVIDDGANGCGGACALTLALDAGCDFVGVLDRDTCADDVVQCSGANGTACGNGGTDVDGDGYSVGPSTCQGDCDDALASVNPGAAESCNGRDDDCDGVVDDGSNACGGACVLSPPLGPSCDAPGPADLDVCTDDAYACSGLNGTACVNGGTDGDGDGYSVGANTCSGDCDDGNPAINAGVAEACDFIDNNCNGVVDENCGCETFVFTGGGSTTDWQNPLNWAPNGTPGVSPNHCAVVPQGLTASLTVAPAHPLASLTVDGTLTHAAGSTTGIDVRVRDRVTIGSTGVIDVSGKGFAGGAGPGAGQNGSSCACNVALAGNGASHAGFAGVSSGATAATYGSVSGPATLGSGGGARACAGSGPGGAGGGRVRIQLSGELVLNGAIRADGLSAPGCAAGGGSGGSVWISAGSVSSDAGVALVTANGGGATSDTCGCGAGVGGGGAGGGRVLLEGFSGALPSAVTLQARGGAGTGSGSSGGAGVVGSRGAGQLGDFAIDNGGLVGGLTPFPGEASLAARSLRVGGQALAAAGAAEQLSFGGELNVEATGRFDLYQPVTVGTVTVGGTLSAVVSSPWGAYVVAGAVNVRPSGAIDVTGRGYTTGVGPGSGGNGTSCACNNGLPGGGGGHGSQGGASGGAAGLAYGSVSGAPVDLGSAGGSRACAPNGPGGNGGGRVRLDVSGELRVDGQVRASGLDAPSCAAGGGAGGSIWITAGSVTSDGGVGRIVANGGAATPDTCGCGAIGGGGGSGGRIVVFADRNELLAGAVTVLAGAGAATGANANPGVAHTYPGADSLVTQVAPTDLDGGLAAGTTLEWTGLAPLGTRHFHVELDDDEHFDVGPGHPETGQAQLALVNEVAGTPGGPLTTTSWTTPPLDGGATYYWHVLVHNSGNGLVGGSSTWRFTVP